MTITQEKAATADQRYTETLDAIRALGTKGSQLAMELDEIIGERLGECRTDGIAEGMGGVVIDGNIMLPGSTHRGSYVTVEIPAAEKPGTSGCPCEFYKTAPISHDLLLGIEDMTVPEAGELIARLIGDQDLGFDGCAVIDDPDDFGRFIGMHNWQDPASMFLFGERADFAANQAWRSPSRQAERIEEGERRRNDLLAGKAVAS